MLSSLELFNLKNVKMVLRNIIKVGLFTTIRYIVSDFLFDMKYQVSTINTTMLDELEIDSPNKIHGHYYEGTNAYIFKQVFSKVDMDVSNSSFVDFGSGKGKAMFLAAEWGFPRVFGVEFSIELIKICRKNIENFKRTSNTKTEFTISHMDAADYQIPDKANLLLFSNPFDEVLIEKVIVNILKSLEMFPREIVVVHMYPQGNMSFVEHPQFQLEHELENGFILRLTPRS